MSLKQMPILFYAFLLSLIMTMTVLACFFFLYFFSVTNESRVIIDGKSTKKYLVWTACLLRCTSLWHIYNYYQPDAVTEHFPLSCQWNKFLMSNEGWMHQLFLHQFSFRDVLWWMLYIALVLSLLFENVVLFFNYNSN